MTKGSLILITGTGACGKTTEVQKLLDLARNKDYNTIKLKFPRYDTPAGKVISAYYKKQFGENKEINPEVIALWYAADRVDAKIEIEKTLNAGVNILLDRYAADNFAYQSARFEGERRIAMLKWIQNLEYNQLGIPQPDLSICLDLPVEETLKSHEERGTAKDIHEEEVRYMHDIRDTFLMMPKFETNFEIFDCLGGRTKRLTVDEVTQGLWEKIQPVLKR